MSKFDGWGELNPHNISFEFVVLPLNYTRLRAVAWMFFRMNRSFRLTTLSQTELHIANHIFFIKRFGIFVLIFINYF